MERYREIMRIITGDIFVVKVNRNYFVLTDCILLLKRRRKRVVNRGSIR